MTRCSSCATESAASLVRLPRGARRSWPACATGCVTTAQRRPRRGTAIVVDRSPSTPTGDTVERGRATPLPWLVDRARRRPAGQLAVPLDPRPRGPPGALRRRPPADGPAPPPRQLAATWASTAQLAGRGPRRRHARRRPAAPRVSRLRRRRPTTRSARSTATDDVDRAGRARSPLAEQRPHPGCGRRPAARRATRPWATCVLVGVPGWTAELDERAQEVADEFAVRLDTAVLFDDVRLHRHRRGAQPDRPRDARRRRPGDRRPSATSSTRSSRSATRPETRELAATLRDEISRVVTELRFSIFDLRHHVAERRLSGALAEYVREVSHATGLRVHLSLDESGPPAVPADRDRAAAGRPGGHRQRPQARPRQQPVGHPRLRRLGSCAWRSRTTASATPSRASATGACRRMRERAERHRRRTSTSPPDPDGGTVVTPAVTADDRTARRRERP